MSPFTTLLLTSFSLILGICLFPVFSAKSPNTVPVLVRPNFDDVVPNTITLTVEQKFPHDSKAFTQGRNKLSTQTLYKFLSM